MFLTAKNKFGVELCFTIRTQTFRHLIKTIVIYIYYVPGYYKLGRM